jgi:hypothetical protein
MDDITFLQQCGIETDPRWLLESLQQDAPQEASNYISSLIRIVDMLGPTQIPHTHRLTD